MDKPLAKLDSASYPLVWAAMTLPQQHLVTGLNSFTVEDHFTIKELGTRINRTRKPIERIVNQLVDAGLFTKQRRGRAGGGRDSTELLTANLDDAAIASEIVAKLAKANGPTFSGQKANGPTFLSQKANGLMTASNALVHLPPTPGHLLPLSDNDSSKEVQSAVGGISSGRASIVPIVDTNAYLQGLSTASAGQAGKGQTPTDAHPLHFTNHSATVSQPLHYPTDQDEAEHSDEQLLPCDAELEWAASFLDVVETESLLSIDPGSLCMGWTLLGPGPAYIDSGAVSIRGGEDVSLRAKHAGETMAALITSHRPTIVVLEAPDFQQDNLRPNNMETFCMAYRAIHASVMASGVRCHCIPASALTKHLPNHQKHQIKEINQRFFQSIVGRAAVEHEADSLRLAWEFLQ